jgi:hypothetical protein
MIDAVSNWFASLGEPRGEKSISEKWLTVIVIIALSAIVFAVNFALRDVISTWVWWMNGTETAHPVTELGDVAIYSFGFLYCVGFAFGIMSYKMSFRWIIWKAFIPYVLFWPVSWIIGLGAVASVSNW